MVRHDSVAISQDGWLINKEVVVVDHHHGCHKEQVCNLVPVSCMPIFVDGLASICRIEVEVHTDMWISHFLFV